MKSLKFLFSYYKSLIVFLIIFVLSTLPSKEVHSVSWFSFENSDKVAHACMYFLLTFILIRDSRKSGLDLPILKIFLYSAAFAFLYGLAIEIIQGVFTDSRSADVFDQLFNTVGIGFAILFYLLFKKAK